MLINDECSSLNILNAVSLATTVRMSGPHHSEMWFSVSNVLAFSLHALSFYYFQEKNTEKTKHMTF